MRSVHDTLHSPWASAPNARKRQRTKQQQGQVQQRKGRDTNQQGYSKGKRPTPVGYGNAFRDQRRTKTGRKENDKKTRVRETYHKRCQQGFDAKDRKIDRVAETNGNTDQNNQQQ